MAGPSGFPVRKPAVAGSFYPADPNQCRALARQYTSVSVISEPTRWLGGVVPHAGWICSGALAGQTIATLGKGPVVDLVVVFGAIHTPIPTRVAAMDSYSSWDVPGDACQVQRELRARMTEGSDLFCVDDRFHDREHAVEVELPLIRSVWPTAAILPIEVPADERAVEVGRRTARAVEKSGSAAVYLASSDLTHYGPNYGFAPQGVGPAGLDWAKKNDRLMIDRILQMQSEWIVPEARAHLNACGAGAIAAMLAACVEHGAKQARLLSHASSFETLAAAGVPQAPDNAVGYASVVVG